MVFISYIILVHLALGFIFLKPHTLIKLYKKLKIKTSSANEHGYYMETQWDYFSIKSRTLEKESNQFVFLGDSLITVLCVENLFNGINLGISAESVHRAKDKILSIENLDNKNIVLAYGINDILTKKEDVYTNYITLINRLPKSATIYIFSVLPVDEDVAKGSIKFKTNQQISELNQLLQNYAESSNRIHFLNTAKYMYDSNGQLKKTLHKGDGLHLNHEGNKLWAKTIKQELAAFNKIFESSLPYSL